MLDSPIKSRTFGGSVDFGAPLQFIGIYTSITGIEGGKNVLYTTVAGTPDSYFNVIDLDSKTLIRSLPIPGAPQSWVHVKDSQNNIYMTGMGGTKIYKYVYADKTIVDLGISLEGEDSLWSLAVDGQDRLYGGSYPRGKMFRYDPQSSAFKNYGTLIEDRAYIRSMGYHEGMIYAGLGAMGSIVVFDTDTEGMETLEVPTSLLTGSTNGEAPYIYDMTITENLLFAQLSGNGLNRVVVYDLVKKQWLEHQFDDFTGGKVSTAMNGKVYMLKKNGSADSISRLIEVNLSNFTTRETGITQLISMKGYGWVELHGDHDLPGATLVSIQFNGTISLMNPQTGIRKEIAPLVEGQAVPIHNLVKGLDGKLYVSGYPGGKGARVNTQTKAVESFELEQMESIGSMNGKIYMGAYPKADIYVLDPNEAIKDEVNPRILFNIGEEQDRPYVFATDGQHGFFGTIPDYGKRGGALVVFEDQGDTVTRSVYRNVVHNQSINGLAPKDGLIYGSTTISGGLDAPANSIEKAAKVFVFDVENRVKLLEVQPVLPGAKADAKMISGLTFDADGLLWAAADGFIFAMDPANHLEVVKVKNIYPDTTNYGMWRPVHLHWGKDGLLYTDLAGILTVIDPVTMEHETLTENGLSIQTQLMTLGDDENIYYASGTRILMIPVSD